MITNEEKIEVLNQKIEILNFDIELRRREILFYESENLPEKVNVANSSIVELEAQIQALREEIGLLSE